MTMRMMMLMMSLAVLAGCAKKENPLLSTWDTPFETPPFNLIKTGHFMPAFLEGIRAEQAEIDQIVNNSESPTFANTIGAMEQKGRLLDRVESVFWCLDGTNTNDELEKIAEEVSPLLTRHSDDMVLNEKLFIRIQTLYKQRESLNLSDEERMLLQNYYNDFIDNGAGLNDVQKTVLRGINEELSHLYVQFGKNHLHETNAAALVLENESDLAGLPDDVKQAAAELAKAKGNPGMWVVTLQKPSFIPFLQYSAKRDLREKVYTAYINRCNNNDEYDNKAIVARIAALRVKKANLMGFRTYADYLLQRNMAKTPENVYRFLNQLWEPALERSIAERNDMQQIVNAEQGDYKLAGWDWWYYGEKLRQQKYNLEESMVRPYLQMEHVRKGAFDVAEKLYGIKFIPRKDIQVWHPDVDVFEVQEGDGSLIGIFYSDYYAREGKRSGAWSSCFRSQSNIGGHKVTPLVYNVGNFTKPTVDMPSLMNMEEMETLFHELGHGLNSLFGNTTYRGSHRVPIDFVELPSQIMENWGRDPEVLKMYAKHYETGDPIPDDILEKLENAKYFNQGFITAEYLAAAFLDMDWHMFTDTVLQDVPSFEKASMEKIGLIPEIVSRYQSTNYGHIFSGDGYSAGYYSYIWAAVLDADAFQAFKDTDLYNRELGNAFRKHVLSHGSLNMMAEYVKFRGAEPNVDALLVRRGLK